MRRDGVSLRGFTQIAAASGAVVEQHQPSPAGRGTEAYYRGLTLSLSLTLALALTLTLT